MTPALVRTLGLLNEPERRRLIITRVPVNQMLLHIAWIQTNFGCQSSIFTSQALSAFERDVSYGILGTQMLCLFELWIQSLALRTLCMDTCLGRKPEGSLRHRSV